MLRQTESDLGALLIHDDTGRGRAFVAAGAPWFMTLFGRDSLLTAWMALPLHVGLSIGTLQQLASVQGRRVDPITEEQPGRIMHEIRRGPASADVLGGSIYYGSVDATPLFVMLLAECWRWGAEEAAVRALLPAADAALAWAENHGDRDGDGFVEYHRATDRGLINQGWKDSFDGDQRRRRAHRRAPDRAVRSPGLPLRRAAGAGRTRRGVRRRDGGRAAAGARRNVARASSSKRSGYPKRVGMRSRSTATNGRSTR